MGHKLQMYENLRDMLEREVSAIEHKNDIDETSLDNLYKLTTALKVVDSMKQNNGWIFCNESLPKKRGWCLAVFKEPDTDFVLVPRVAEYLLGLRTSGTTEEGWIILNCTDKNDACEYYKKLKCIAWQPIPTLPKKEV